MTAAVMTAAGAARAERDERFHQAMFWRSPFAVSAAVVLSTQLSMIALAGAAGEQLYDAALPLTGLSATLLAAGVWPGWNYVRISEDGIDQQAGLRSLKVAWRDVQHVRVFDGWVELRVVTGAEPGRKKVRTRRVFNRYDVPSAAFGEAIEAAWLRGRS